MSEEKLVKLTKDELAKQNHLTIDTNVTISDEQAKIIAEVIYKMIHKL